MGIPCRVDEGRILGKIGLLGSWAAAAATKSPLTHQTVATITPGTLSSWENTMLSQAGNDFHKDPCFWAVACTQKVPAMLSSLLEKSWISLHFPGLAVAPHLGQDSPFLSASCFNFPPPFPGSLLLAECDNARCQQSPELPFRGGKN